MTHERTIDHASVDVFPFEIRGDDTRYCLADRLYLPTFQGFVIEYVRSEEREREREREISKDMGVWDVCV